MYRGQVPLAQILNVEEKPGGEREGIQQGGASGARGDDGGGFEGAH